MNALVILAVLAVTVCSVNGACNLNAVLSCTTAYSEGIQNSNNDMASVCQMSKTYLSCVRNTGCAEADSVKSQLSTAEQIINDKCGACQVQVSLLCLALMFVALMFSK